MNEWIRIKNKFPSGEQLVLVLYKNALDPNSIYYACIGYYADETWELEIQNSSIIPCVTHWMPLPELPRE